jgi:sarcosine oxidase, subunit gamma
MASGFVAESRAALRLDVLPIAAAWNVQGDATELGNTVRQLFGVTLPDTNGSIASDAILALWLGPRSWLLVQADAEGPLQAAAFDASRDRLHHERGALFDLTASRVAFRITGAAAATLLAKGCPLDFHSRVFVDGACAQSVFGHVTGLFYRPPGTDALVMMVARSFARDAWKMLTEAAAQYEAETLPTGLP